MECSSAGTEMNVYKIHMDILWKLYCKCMERKICYFLL